MNENGMAPPAGYPELRLVLLGTIGCGKSHSGDTILQTSPGASGYTSPRICRKRQGPSEGRMLTLVETPRWYWSGGRVEATIRRETTQALSLTAPGPHAFLLLIPVGQFTEVEGRVPSQMEEMFGQGVLRHTLVLFTCGDYLMGKGMEEYLAGEEPGLKEVLDRCGGRYHVINNRSPQDRGQVRSLLEKVENMVRINGDCYVHHIAAPVDAERRPVDRTWSSNPMVLKTQNRRESWDGSRLTGMEERDGGVEEMATAKQLPNGLHAAAPPRRTSDSSSPWERRTSYRLSAEGALLSQLMDEKPAPSYVNTIFHRISSTSEEPPPTISHPSGSMEDTVFPSPAPFLSTTLPEMRLLILGRRGMGKRDVGNSILGKEAFLSRGGADQECERKTAIVAGNQVAVVLTPDWLDSDHLLEDVQKGLSEGLSLSSPGPHAFLLCVSVDQPAAAELRALGAVEGILGPDALRSHSVVLFTRGKQGGHQHAELEEHIASHREDLMQLVEKCGDRYHVMEPGSVGELLEKVEQAVKESGGRCYSHGSNHRGMEAEEGALQMLSSSLQSVKEVEEDAVEQKGRLTERHMDQPDSPASVSSSSSSPSLLHSLLLRVVEVLKGVPKLLAGGALLGGTLGIYLGGPVGGAVGATVGTVATEVGRRKYSVKMKTQ
ncbi:LOW QUALITY PROTEIN: uncharacterized protein LOC125742088 [Brienomyrus brachyistius]|uniref:LOW QUALITY PROTEIN: uncharacterized protein LOC125742088 n=1 Tax=Brienomyrus brachyistius TaxID=42636 RepID=UPI0020B2D4F1|nr:LOW QUALITY PROTEIN: uncharacterized protein LOC125742088 [Brienomyrus brachyistius]